MAARPSRKESKYYGGSIPWVKTGNLPDGLIKEVDEHITDLGLQNSSAKIFPHHKACWLRCIGATIGKLGILAESSTTNQACGALIAEGITKDLIPYIFYYLLNSREDLRDIGKGGAQPNISQTVLKQLSNSPSSPQRTTPHRHQNRSPNHPQSQSPPSPRRHPRPTRPVSAVRPRRRLPGRPHRRLARTES